MEHTAQVMGIAGAGRGTGVTHFVIQAANYLCSCRQKKTAILQWNPQKDLEKIRAFLGAGGKEDSRSFKKKDHFRLLGVDYYYEGTFPGPGGGFLLSGRTGGTGCVYGKRLPGNTY